MADGGGGSGGGGGGDRGVHGGVIGALSEEGSSMRLYLILKSGIFCSTNASSMTLDNFGMAPFDGIQRILQVSFCDIGC